MTSRNFSQDISHIQDASADRHPRQPGRVDFTFMYAAHDAFNRDLRRLAAAVEAGRTAEPAVQAGWATFKHQLHIHHTAEDRWLWPALRDQVRRPDETSVLDLMEVEHAQIEPLLARVADDMDSGSTSASQASGGQAGAGQADTGRVGGARVTLADDVGELTALLTTHMEHEEDEALPLVEKYLGPSGWAEFGRKAGRSAGLRAAAELFPWILDGASADTSRRLLGMLPPPVRIIYRALWRPTYARTPRWDAA